MKQRKKVALDKIEPVKTSLLPQKENRVDLSQSTFLTINLVFSTILKKYESIKNDFVKFVNDFNLNSDQIKRLAQLMYAENPSFSTRRRNYTPI